MKLFNTSFFTPLKQSAQRFEHKPATMLSREAKVGTLSPTNKEARAGAITLSGHDHSEGGSGSSQ